MRLSPGKVQVPLTRLVSEGPGGGQTGAGEGSLPSFCPQQCHAVCGLHLELLPLRASEPTPRWP